MTQRPLGETRTHVCSDHAVIGMDSYVTSPLFGWQKTSGVVLISPAMGCSSGQSAMRGPGFAQYLASVSDDSRTSGAAPGIQRCIYVLSGQLSINDQKLGTESFAYLPADSQYDLRGIVQAKCLVFEKAYVPLEGVEPPKLRIGKLDDITAAPFLGDEDARLACLLPDDPAFDMAVNVFTYQSGAALPFVETHVMEHGLYMTAGQGVYRLNQSWYPVAEGDSIWMAAYCPQWFVAMGKKPAQYVYYKDVNRNHLL
jgi:(S)-ureidoglycine aminohydrolase